MALHARVSDVVFNRGEVVSTPAVQDASWLSYSCRTVRGEGWERGREERGWGVGRVWGWGDRGGCSI